MIKKYSKNNLENQYSLLTAKYNDIDPTQFYDIIIDFDSLKESCETEKGFNVFIFKKRI